MVDELAPFLPGVDDAADQVVGRHVRSEVLQVRWQQVVFGDGHDVAPGDHDEFVLLDGGGGIERPPESGMGAEADLRAGPVQVVASAVEWHGEGPSGRGTAPLGALESELQPVG